MIPTDPKLWKETNKQAIKQIKEWLFSCWNKMNKLEKQSQKDFETETYLM